MKLLDVTDQVEFGNNDDEWLSLNKCVCGERFDKDGGCLSLGFYEDIAHECPVCKRKFIFKVKINVYEIEKE